jgi:hypothetical protein
MNKPRAIGTWTETAVTRVLLRNGFPRAERSALHGAKDQGDITGTPVCWEVKGGKAAEQASDGQVLAWMAELDTECVHKGADVGVLVLKRKGVGAANADRWWAVMWLIDLYGGVDWRFDKAVHGIPVRMTLADACRVLSALGYGGAA